MKKYKLLSMHMNCNPHYILGHAHVAGMLSDRKLTTYTDYVNECKSLGIEHYSEETFNDFCIDYRITQPQM